MAVCILLLTACSDNQTMAQPTTSDMKIDITIGETTLPVVLVDNEATRALLNALQTGPITYEANDYGGFEKVGALNRSLPTADERITTQAGDVILYNGNQIVLFYGSNTWSYTRLGRIQYTSVDELKAFLKAGQGRVSVTLSIPQATVVKTVSTATHDGTIYDLSGNELAQEPETGIYIKNGKKYIK